ncbi:MAG: hypothetical protein CTY15_00505 [Methylocystis sp.]|nr:MAG: hypothetical protein CTY15_00505 [Methylocystis sp.]
MEEAMSRKFIFAAATLGVVLTSAPAFAYDRYYDFGEVWGRSTQQHRRDEALSATPRDVTRHQTPNVYRPGAHDPSGNIILEGAM